MKTYPVLN